MNVKEENVCRLCLNVANNEFYIIDENTTKMFNTLLLELNLTVCKDPIICSDCAEVLKKCFYFKTVCIDTEELIFTFSVSKSGATIELGDILKDISAIETVDEDFVCRFCMNRLRASNYVLLDTVMKDSTIAKMLPILLPKMDMTLIKNPVMCTSCMYNLECYIKFVETCLDTEEKISKYCQNKTTPGIDKVNLIDILHFLEVAKITQIQEIKQEEDELNIDIAEALSEVYHNGSIKCDVLDIKDEVDFNETPSDMSIYEARIFKAENENILNSSHILTDNSISYGEKNKCTMRTFETKNEGDIINHMSSHTKFAEKKMYYKCTMCTFQTKCKRNVKTHMLIHKDNVDVEIYKCTMCTYESKLKANVKKHMLIHKDITEVEMYKCEMCTFETKLKGNLGRHMLTHKDNVEVEIYKCTICNYKSKLKGNLKRHLLTHKNDTKVEISKVKVNVQKCMIVHEGIKDVELYKCTLCAYETSRKSDFEVHMLAKEDMEMETYKCSMCTYETKQKSSLESHMLIHKYVTVEIYKCTVCTYETSQKGNFKEHMLIHKGITEVKKYKCSMCPHATKDKTNLKRHMLVHKDITEVEMYKCPICTFETKHKKGVKCHMLIHKDSTQINMYKCSMCIYKTKQKSSITRHMLIHKDVSEVKMYKCTVCTYKTKYRHYLKTHIKTHKC